MMGRYRISFSLLSRVQAKKKRPANKMTAKLAVNEFRESVQKWCPLSLYIKRGQHSLLNYGVCSLAATQIDNIAFQEINGIVVCVGEGFKKKQSCRRF